MKRAFDDGWGGVICKTLSLDASKVRKKGRRLRVCARLRLCADSVPVLLSGHQRDAALRQADRAAQPRRHRLAKHRHAPAPIPILSTH
jgi:hypothetical protein